MIVFYRLLENWLGYDEGSCITESKYKNICYLDKPLFEQVTEEQARDMIKFYDENYCSEKGIEFLLFYTQLELELFNNKNLENGFAD